MLWGARQSATARVSIPVDVRALTRIDVGRSTTVLVSIASSGGCAHPSPVLRLVTSPGPWPSKVFARVGRLLARSSTPSARSTLLAARMPPSVGSGAARRRFCLPLGPLPALVSSGVTLDRAAGSGSRGPLGRPLLPGPSTRSVRYSPHPPTWTAILGRKRGLPPGSARGRKVALFSALRCTAQGGWGGSAH